MKKILTFLAVLSIFAGMITDIFAQEHKCLHNKEYSLSVSPAALPVAIPTKGWNYDSTSSTEPDFLPDNEWRLHGYTRSNANNEFSNDTAYWKLYSGILNLYLKNDTFIYQNPPDTFLNSNDRIVYGFEWLPETYSFYINNHLIRSRIIWISMMTGQIMTMVCGIRSGLEMLLVQLSTTTVAILFGQPMELPLIRGSKSHSGLNLRRRFINNKIKT